jgi:hypothetical protein
MVASRNPDSSASPYSADPDVDPLDAVIGAITDPAFGVAVPPTTRSATAARSSFTPSALPPPSTRSLPLSASNMGGGARGHLSGKQPLFRYGASKDGTLCCGFIGGASGSRLRFCTKVLSPDSKHCGDGKHGSGKFDITPEAYYISMERDSALCRPFLRLADVQAFKEMAIVQQSLPSREWVSVVNDFWVRHNLVPSAPRSTDSLTSPLDLEVKGEIAHDDEAVGDLFADNMSRLSHESREESAFKFPATEQDDEASKGPATSAASRSTVGSMMDPWFSMAPTNYFPDPPHYLPEEKLFPYCEDARRSIVSLQHSVSRMLGRLPKVFDELDTRLGDNFVSSVEFSREAIQPIQELDARLTEMQRSAFYQPSQELQSSGSVWSDHGSLASFSQFLADRITQLERNVESTSGSALKMEMNRLATKMAHGLKAVAVKAVEQTQALEQRLDGMSVTHGDMGSENDAGGLFDELMGNVAPRASNPTTSATQSGVLGRVDGADVTLSGLVSIIQAQQAECAALKKEILQVKSSAFSTGVKMGGHQFDDVDDIVQVIEADGCDPSFFSTHVDACSIFSHFADGNARTESNTTELKAMRSAGVTDPTCCAYVASFRQNVPPYLLGDSGATVPVGSRFPLLKNREAWEGRTALQGARALLKRAVRDAHTTTKEYIACNLPSSSILKDLADTCNTVTLDFWTALSTHIDDEILTLSKYGIPEEKVYTLISDELQIIFRQIFVQRMKMQVFSDNRDPAVYYARAIFTTLKAHAVMQEFSDLGFGTHVLISSLFTRFLAEQTGANHGAGLSTQITRLESDLKKQKNDVTTKVNAINARLDKMDPKIKTLEATCNKN